MKRRSANLEALFETYRIAKARHDVTIEALKQAARWREPPDADLVKRQAEAACEEIDALIALRGALS